MNLKFCGILIGLFSCSAAQWLHYSSLPARGLQSRSRGINRSQAAKQPAKNQPPAPRKPPVPKKPAQKPQRHTPLKAQNPLYPGGASGSSGASGPKSPAAPAKKTKNNVLLEASNPMVSDPKSLTKKQTLPYNSKPKTSHPPAVEEKVKIVETHPFELSKLVLHIQIPKNGDDLAKSIELEENS